MLDAAWGLRGASWPLLGASSASLGAPRGSRGASRGAPAARPRAKKKAKKNKNETSQENTFLFFFVFFPGGPAALRGASGGLLGAILGPPGGSGRHLGASRAPRGRLETPCAASGQPPNAGPGEGWLEKQPAHTPQTASPLRASRASSSSAGPLQQPPVFKECNIAYKITFDIHEETRNSNTRQLIKNNPLTNNIQLKYE